MAITGIDTSSYYSDYYTNASQASTEALENTLNGVNSETTDEELMEACKEFEAYLWEQVLSEMTKSVNFGIDEESSSSSMVGYFKEEAMKEIAGQITESTTSSLAQSLYEQMKRNYEV